MTEEEYYARIKAAYEASTDDKLVEWARPYFEGTKKPNGKKKFRICPVSSVIAECIKQLTGSDIQGFTHCISADEVTHIRIKHGENGKSDNTIRNIDDLGRIAFVLNYADKLTLLEEKSKKFKNSKNQNADIVLFEMRVDGHIYTSEAVTDSKKKMLMCVNTMYKDYVKDTKKSQVPDARKSVLVAHVRNELGLSISILPQSEKNVKPSNENNSDCPKPVCEQQFEQRLAERRQAHLADIEAMNIPPERKAELRQKIDEIYSVKPPTIAEIKSELRGKSPQEIGEMARHSPQNIMPNGKKQSNNGGKSPSGNGNGGSSGR